MTKCNGTKFLPHNSISLTFWTIFFTEKIRYPFNIFPVIGTWGTKYLKELKSDGIRLPNKLEQKKNVGVINPQNTTNNCNQFWTRKILILSKRYESIEVGRWTWLHVPSGTLLSTSSNTHQVVDIQEDVMIQINVIWICVLMLEGQDRSSDIEQQPLFGDRK